MARILNGLTTKIVKLKYNIHMKIYCLRCCKPIELYTSECPECGCDNFSIFTAKTDELWSLFYKFYEKHDFYRSYTIIQFLYNHKEPLASYYKGVLYDEYKTKYSKEDAFKISLQLIKQAESLDISRKWLEKNKDRTQALQTKEIKVVKETSYFEKEASGENGDDVYRETIIAAVDHSCRVPNIIGYEGEILDADFGYLEDFPNFDTNDY